MLTLDKKVANLPEDEFKEWLQKRYPVYYPYWKKYHKGERNKPKPKPKTKENKEAAD